MADLIVKDSDGWLVQIQLDPEQARFVAEAIRSLSPKDGAAKKIDELADAAEKANEEDAS